RDDSKEPSIALLEGLHDRLALVAGHLSYADLADRTGCNHETVRRYMRGGTPSITFVVSVSIAFDCSLNWLLLGSPPRAMSEVTRTHWFRSKARRLYSDRSM